MSTDDADIREIAREVVREELQQTDQQSTTRRGVLAAAATVAGIGALGGRARAATPDGYLGSGGDPLGIYLADMRGPDNGDAVTMPALRLKDDGADPTSNGGLARNGSDVKVYSGGSVVNLSTVGGGGALTDSGADTADGNGDLYQLPQAADGIDFQGDGAIRNAEEVTTDSAVNRNTSAELQPLAAGSAIVHNDDGSMASQYDADDLPDAFAEIAGTSQGRGKVTLNAVISTLSSTASIPERSTLEGLGPETTQIQTNSDIVCIDVDGTANARQQTIRDVYFAGFNATTSTAINLNNSFRGGLIENVKIKNHAAAVVQPSGASGFEARFRDISAIEVDPANGGYNGVIDLSGGFTHTLDGLAIYPTNSRSGTLSPALYIDGSGGHTVEGTFNCGGNLSYVIVDEGRIGSTISGTVNGEPNSTGADAVIKHEGDGSIDVSGRVIINDGKGGAPPYGIEIAGGGGGYLSRPETVNGASPTARINVTTPPTAQYIYEGSSGEVADNTGTTGWAAGIYCLGDQTTVQP